MELLGNVLFTRLLFLLPWAEGSAINDRLYRALLHARPNIRKVVAMEVLHGKDTRDLSKLLLLYVPPLPNFIMMAIVVVRDGLHFLLLQGDNYNRTGTRGNRGGISLRVEVMLIVMWYPVVFSTGVVGNEKGG